MPLKAIVVDDDIDTAEVLTEYLQIKDFEVLAIGNNGREAVELYKKHQPDVVFLDVMMPDFDGFYGLRFIREYDPNAIVIMVTADLSTDTEKKLEEMKASAIIYKPYDIDSLVDTVNKSLPNDSVMLPQADN